MQHKIDQPIQGFVSPLEDKKHNIDSKQSQISNKIDSVSKLSQRFTHIADTLRPNLSRYSRRLDSLKGKLTNRIDSLTKLGLPTSRYTRLLDSIQRAGPPIDIKQAEAKLVSLQKKVNEPVTKLNGEVNKLQGKLNQKLSLLNNQGGAGANLPGNVNLPNLNAGVPSGAGLLSDNLPSGQLGLPAIQGQGITPSMPNTNLSLPSSTLATNSSNPINGNQNLPGEINGLGNATGEMKNVSGAQGELSKFKRPGELDHISKELGEIKQLTNQAKGYSNDVKNISNGNLDSLSQVSRAAEKQAMQLGGMNELQGKSAKLDQYKSMASQGNNPEALKEIASQQALPQVIDHFAGHEKEIQAAMGKLSDLKQKYASLQSIKELPKRIPNEMHGLRLIERLIPGFNLQIQKRNDLLLDFNPSLSYRITGRWTAGLGWNERIGINTKQKSIVPIDHIYGVRSFVQFKIKDGFQVKAEVESMNAFVPPSVLLAPDGHPGRQWVWTYFAGLKKDYRFSKSVMGNVQILYNLYNPYKMSPYASNINVRLGFEFPMKRGGTSIRGR